MNYKKYFTYLMAITEASAIACILLMTWALIHNSIAGCVVTGFLAVILTIITMSMHILVRMEELK